MELTISKRDFLRGLARTHAVADRKSSMAILSNILLSTEGPGKLRLAATDLYLGVTASAPAEVLDGGSVAVAARNLFDIVKALPDGKVHLAVGDNEAVRIRAGKVDYKIPGMPGDDFPPLPNPGDEPFVALDGELVGDLISRTQYSMSTDDTRPHLAGALFEGSGSALRMVTTDGHRLCKGEAQVEGDGLSFSMLVPAKGIGELRRLIEDAKASHEGDGPVTIEVATTGGNAFFRRGDVQLSVKLADEQFPPYEKVIPKSAERHVVIARSALHEALKRISLVASDKNGSVRLDVDAGTLRIVSENPEVGEGSEELDVDYAGGPLVIGFNAKYLLDVLGSLTANEVALDLSGELDPGVVRPVGDTRLDFVGVIMPMRI